MERSNYDILYGMDLGAYCKMHNTSVRTLIRKVEIDIEIFKKNFKKEYTGMIPTTLGDEIYNAIEKKQKHLNRLQEWEYDSRSKREPTRIDVYILLVQKSLEEQELNNVAIDPKVPDQRMRKANRYAVKNTEKEYRKLTEEYRKKKKEKNDH